MGPDHTFDADGPADGPPDAPGDAEVARLLDGLDPGQRAAVTTPGHPLCILAGAGSGKTRVLTRRIAYRLATGSALPRHVLALTFTRRAAGELGRRLAQLGVPHQLAAGTFHAIAYAQLRRYWADSGERAPGLLDHKARVLVPLLPRRQGAAVQPADIASEIEWAKARLVRPEAYEEAVTAAGRRSPVPASLFATLYRRYEDEKRRRGLVDFDDLVLHCAKAMEVDAEFATTQRWRFRHLFVDEFQDVNPAQLRLLDGWRGGRPDLCVVGDPDQAIYSWNGADASFLTGFAHRLPGATVVHLDRNYRSSPEVIGAANAVIDGHRATGAHRLTATRPRGPAPKVVSYRSDRDEAVGIARALRRRREPGRPWSDLAVLTRTHAQLVLLEESLRGAGIPYRLRGATAFLDRPEVRQALGGLRRLPAAGPLSTALPDLRQLAVGAEGGRRPIDDGGPADPVAERRAHLEELVRLAEEQLGLDPAASIGGFLAWLTTALRSGEAGQGRGRDTDAVELATFHAAKGLEWPVVFLGGLEQGLVPVGQADTPEARAEERRLLYVAVTRAQRELHCSWAERRTFGARTASRTPSPWLATIEAVVAALSEGREPGDWRRHLDQSRTQVRAAAGGRQARPSAVLGEGADPGVMAALRSWRAGAAKAAGVPAFVVFHDSTLAAVAEAQPRNRTALLALPGLGPVKAERYGEALLAVVADAAAARAG